MKTASILGNRVGLPTKSAFGQEHAHADSVPHANVCAHKLCALPRSERFWPRRPCRSQTLEVHVIKSNIREFDDSNASLVLDDAIKLLCVD
jgi:hypothetical protein